MERKISFKNNKSQRLVGLLNVPKGKGPFGAVVICHGLSSSKDSKYHEQIGQQLAKAKIVALRFDLAGHGESQGKFAEVIISQGIKDIESAIRYLKSFKFVDKNRIGLMGISLSGVQAQFVAAKNNVIKVLVLFAPATDFPTMRLERWKKQRFDEWKKNGFIWYKPNLKLNYSFHLDSKKRVGYKTAPKIKAKTLMIHGEKDDVVPIRMTKKFFAGLKCPKKLMVIKGGGHKVSGTFYEERVARLTSDWFKKYL